jgi:Putative peptidoglycan binding domain.
VLQRALASLAYSPGAVDGNYGTSTQRAVARFQSFSNLTPDGILGPQTLLALRNALKGP